MKSENGKQRKHNQISGREKPLPLIYKCRILCYTYPV